MNIGSGGATYDRVRAGFDTLFYVATHADFLRSRYKDPIKHFLARGDRKGMAPSPYFSQAAYKSRYADLGRKRRQPFRHFALKGQSQGRIGNPFRAFEDFAKATGQDPVKAENRLIADHRDVQERLRYGELGEMVGKAAALDPLIAQTWPEALQHRIPPFLTPDASLRLSIMMRLQRAAQHQRAHVVILVNQPRWGGARRLEGYIAHALSQIISGTEIVVISTDKGGQLPPGKLPTGARYVDFASHTNGLSDNAKARVLVEFLRSMQPDAIFSVNSRLFWEALLPFGKALAASTRIFPCFFCNEQTPLGYWTGYPLRYFYRYFDIASGVCVDSHYLKSWFGEMYGVPETELPRIHVLEAPVDAGIPLAQSPVPSDDRRKKVYWAGRFDRQKRVDIVYGIAEAMPHVDFHLWGEAVMANAVLAAKPPPNVTLEGKYARFEDLDLSKADAWLYTSEWDGVPSMLLEVAMTGVPLVGSLVGGTGEVLQPDLSHGIAQSEDIPSYVTALETVFADAEGARQRAGKLRETLLQQRTAEDYQNKLRNIVWPGGTFV